MSHLQRLDHASSPLEFVGVKRRDLIVENCGPCSALPLDPYEASLLRRMAAGDTRPHGRGPGAPAEIPDRHRGGAGLSE